MVIANDQFVAPNFNNLESHTHGLKVKWLSDNGFVVNKQMIYQGGDYVGRLDRTGVSEKIKQNLKSRGLLVNENEHTLDEVFPHTAVNREEGVREFLDVAPSVEGVAHVHVDEKITPILVPEILPEVTAADLVIPTAQAPNEIPKKNYGPTQQFDIGEHAPHLGKLVRLDKITANGEISTGVNLRTHVGTHFGQSTHGNVLPLSPGSEEHRIADFNRIVEVRKAKGWRVPGFQEPQAENAPVEAVTEAAQTDAIVSGVTATYSANDTQYEKDNDSDILKILNGEPVSSNGYEKPADIIAASTGNDDSKKAANEALAIPLESVTPQAATSIASVPVETASSEDVQQLETDLAKDRLAYGKVVYQQMSANRWSVGTLADNLNQTLDARHIPEVASEEIMGWMFGDSVPHANVAKALSDTLINDLPISDAEKDLKRAALQQAYETSQAAIETGAPATDPARLAYGQMLLALRHEPGKELFEDEVLAQTLNQTPRFVRDAGIPTAGFTGQDVTRIIYGQHPLTPAVHSLLSRTLEGDSEVKKLDPLYQRVQETEQKITSWQARVEEQHVVSGEGKNGAFEKI